MTRPWIFDHPRKKRKEKRKRRKRRRRRRRRKKNRIDCVARCQKFKSNITQKEGLMGESERARRFPPGRSPGAGAGGRPLSSEWHHWIFEKKPP